MLELYKNIKKFRKANHLTQSELSKKANYKDTSSISLIENGGNDLPFSKVMMFAEIFDVDVHTLIGYEKTSPLYITKLYQELSLIDKKHLISYAEFLAEKRKNKDND